MEAHFYSNGYAISEDAPGHYLECSGPEANVRFSLPTLEAKLGNISDRFLDLLEIAAYVYCADRRTHRGSKDSPNMTGWTADIYHHIRIVDWEFWKRAEVLSSLQKVLNFVSSQRHHFDLEGGYERPHGSLFTAESFWPPDGPDGQVVLFSGGIDSTSGAYRTLSTSSRPLILASHVSRNETLRTQRGVLEGLRKEFGARVSAFDFRCTLTGSRGVEESQRTRSFLFAAVGFIVAMAYGLSEVSFFENGARSVHLPPSEQYKNARASRTTHPLVLRYLENLLTLVADRPITVSNPYVALTKAEVVKELVDKGGGTFLGSTVSCSKTFDRQMGAGHTHCGRCSQCIERRIAIAAAGASQHDELSLYRFDLVVDDITGGRRDRAGLEAKTTLVDYLRLADELRNLNYGAFGDAWLDELTDLDADGYLLNNPSELESCYQLHVRFGRQVFDGVKALTMDYFEPFSKHAYERNSLLQVFPEHEYLVPAPNRLAQEIATLLESKLPAHFKARRPADEKELQDAIDTIVNLRQEEFRREYPLIPVFTTNTKPDFAALSNKLLIEAKYPRGSKTLTKLRDELSADVQNYGGDVFILFLIYDPEGKITDIEAMAQFYEESGRCKLQVVRF